MFRGLDNHAILKSQGFDGLCDKLLLFGCEAISENPVCLPEICKHLLRMIWGE